jgi:hypothetical protein
MAVRLSTLRPGRPLLPAKISGTHFCYRLSRPQDHSAAGRIWWIEKSNDLIGTRTRYLPVCSIVPQPTTLPPASPGRTEMKRKSNLDRPPPRFDPNTSKMKVSSVNLNYMTVSPYTPYRNGFRFRKDILCFHLHFSTTNFQKTGTFSFKEGSLQPPAHAGSSLADFFILKMEAICCSETSVHTKTQRHIPRDGILLGSNCLSSFSTLSMAAAFIIAPKRKKVLWSEDVRTNILYNVRGTGPLLTTKCTVFGYLVTVWIVNLFLFTISHVRNYNHNHLLRCVTFTQLTNLHANIPFLTSSHTLQIKPSIHTLHLLHIRAFRNDLLPRTYS